MAPPAQHHREQVALRLEVERLQLDEPLQVLRRGVVVALRALEAGQAAEDLGGEVAQALALGQRPLRVGLVGEEVAAVRARRRGELGVGAVAVAALERLQAGAARASKSSASIATRPGASS